MTSIQSHFRQNALSSLVTWHRKATLWCLPYWHDGDDPICVPFWVFDGHKYRILDRYYDYKWIAFAVIHDVQIVIKRLCWPSGNAILWSVGLSGWGRLSPRELLTARLLIFYPLPARRCVQTDRRVREKIDRWELLEKVRRIEKVIIGRAART